MDGSWPGDFEQSFNSPDHHISPDTPKIDQLMGDSLKRASKHVPAYKSYYVSGQGAIFAYWLVGCTPWLPTLDEGRFGTIKLR
jgi:hypothetical protein